MTLPNERTNALNNTRDFLRDLLDPKKTPRVPKSVRQWASRCLRHFPGSFDVFRAAQKCPEIFDNALDQPVFSDEPKTRKRK